MSKVKAVVIACSAVLAGIVIGGLLVGYACIRTIKFINSGNEARAYTSAAQSFMLLDQLRRGDVQSPIDSLEVQLDGDLISLWGYHKDAPADKRDPHLLKLLAKVRDYRAKYPHRIQHPELDRTIAEVLGWAR